MCNKKHFAKKCRRIHVDWIKDCSNDYKIELWGRGISDDCSIASLQRKIDNFKPDYIYLTLRARYKWLPDLTSIKVPKIFVEVDTCYYDANDSWYKQFDKVYSRQSKWFHKFSKILSFEEYSSIFNNLNDITKQKYHKYNLKMMYSTYYKCVTFCEPTWEKVPLFRWSVSNADLECVKISPRHSEYNKSFPVRFVGKINSVAYGVRQQIKREFPEIAFYKTTTRKEYYNIIKTAQALVCPTENLYGDYVPTKIFEYAASGAAVITNCNLIDYNMADLDEVVIRRQSCG